MSKAHMVVLSFLKVKPFHAYQIGQLVEQLALPRWTGVTLPAIYKAMQTLEKQKYIRGEEMRVGTSPPRMVYHLNAKGRQYLQKTVIGYLNDTQLTDRDWWLALFFAQQNTSKAELLNAIEQRILRLKEVQKKKRDIQDCPTTILGEDLPFVHHHLMELGLGYIRAELRSLCALQKDIQSDEHDGFFIPIESSATQKGAN
ncbi:MAG: PadR family transcriptional regulator [Candidatus Cloacimonetes bacterium]|nr:PadR family transcriptional regulator [Candidatus Cloacimonadota bacterium]